MHKYLKAIGFSDAKLKKEEDELIKQTVDFYTDYNSVFITEEYGFAEYCKEYGDRIGVKVCGQMNEMKKFKSESYFPYLKGSGITSHADITIEQKIDKVEYLGVCEDVRIGISLIFHLQNIVEYLKEIKSRTIYDKRISVTLCGLSESGTILFPIQKPASTQQMKKEKSKNRMMLLNAARNGDKEAIESLTMEEMDIYSKVNMRIATEDIFTLVDTYFMPYGLDCTMYSILGEILEIQVINNKITQEELYIMKLEVNELQFDVCVPIRGILGEPKVGRRLKTNIWLQGNIHFE